MKLLLLSKENIPLARGEAEALLGKGKLNSNILLVSTKRTTDRLAYTKLITNLLFQGNKKSIEKKIKEFNWNKIIKNTFSARVYVEGKSSETLGRLYGGIIYDKLKSPRVDLNNPDTEIVFIKENKTVYAGILEWKNKEEFFARRPNQRPAQMPITILPKVARACVNLTGSNTEIYDPMCGIGGFLIEAGLMNLKAIGSDIDNKMRTYSSTNLNHYKINKFLLFRRDALELNEKNKKYSYIVTDVPYGKNTKNIGRQFYPKFIKVLGKILKKRAVLMFPNFANAEKLLKKSKLKIKAKYLIYIHSSLTREIFVLEPKK